MNLKGGRIIPDNFLRGEIRFQDVTFAYPTRKQQVFSSIKNPLVDLFLLILGGFGKLQLIGPGRENGCHCRRLRQWKIHYCGSCRTVVSTSSSFQFKA